MLTRHTRLRPNEKEVAAKVLDGEAIMINLTSGAYYSMDEVGGLIWEMIDARHSLGEIVAAVIARYDVSSEPVQRDVQRLAAQLVDENLVMVSDDEAPLGASEAPEPQQKLPYTSPNLNIYRDMADLLAIDPPTPELQEIVWKEPDDDAPR